MRAHAYSEFNMGTAMSIARNIAIIDFMQAARKASTDEIAAGTGIDKRAVHRHLYHLCETKNLELLAAKTVRPGAPAVYGWVEGSEYASPAEFFEQRRVAADDWPRGQHAHRSGLLAALFPLASQGA